MKYFYKSLAVIVAITIAISCFGKQVKAVVEAGAAAVAVTGASVAATFLIVDLLSQAYSGVEQIVRDAQVQNALQRNERVQALIGGISDTKVATEAYLEQRKQVLINDSYFIANFESMSDEEIIRYIANSQSYLNSLSGSPSESEKLVYNVLKAVEDNAKNMSIDNSEYYISLTGEAYSRLYSDALSNVFGVDAILDGEGSLRQMVFHETQDVVTNIIALGNVYGAITVCENGIYPSVFLNSGTEYYFYSLATDGSKVAFGESSNTILSTYIYTHESTGLPAFLEFRNPVPSAQVIWNYLSSDGTKYYYRSLYGLNFDSLETGERVGQAPLRAEDYFDDASAISIYAYVFTTIEQAEAMHEYFEDSVISGVNPFEAEGDKVVVDVNPSSIEKLIEKAKDVLGLDDVDIVVSPGAVVDEDGDIVYSPSLSIAGTDIKDLENDKAGEAEGEDSGLKDDDFQFIYHLSYQFPLYEQCKELLKNLFNYNDVVQPPSFKFYWDSNGDGKNEVYDVLDLSFLETSLNNKNMVDKGWWSTPIKVIDIIRYVIAAVIYGLFVMRLLKRLPYFYGGGPWAHL